MTSAVRSEGLVSTGSGKGEASPGGGEGASRTASKEQELGTLKEG